MKTDVLERKVVVVYFPLEFIENIITDVGQIGRKVQEMVRQAKLESADEVRIVIK